MNSRLSILKEDELDLLLSSLGQNHLREIREEATTQVQSRRNIHNHHSQEMALISLVFSPFDWAMAIRRYTRQLTEAAAIATFDRALTKIRHQRETVELKKWIKQQRQLLLDTLRTDVLFLNRLNKLFEWSFSKQQWYTYHQALSTGYALVLTDTNKSIVWVSRAFEIMTGYQSVDVVGGEAQFLQGKSTGQATIQYIYDQLDQAGEVDAELINYRKNGEPYLCHLQINSLTNREGKCLHFMAIQNEIKVHERIH